MAYRIVLITVFLFALLSCTGSTYTRLQPADDMSKYEGRKVEIAGRLSRTPWQHLMANPEGYGLSYYFDVGDFQIVLYSKSAIACSGPLAVRGTVIKVRGSSKRPGSKADESYVEYHLAVDDWTCGN